MAAMRESVNERLGTGDDSGARRSEVWQRISRAYEQGGQEAVAKELRQLWEAKMSRVEAALEETQDLV